MGERDQRISLLDRLLLHANATARYSIYYGEGRDAFDVRGRTAHESVLNVNDGSYRCPNSQGERYSPFSILDARTRLGHLGSAKNWKSLDTLQEQGTAEGGFSHKKIVFANGPGYG